jgi:hypothetical protein
LNRSILKSGGELLVEALRLHGADHAFCVPGESYLAVLDALHDAPEIALTTCRQEGGAAMMAEAYGKLTGRPGICMVTRGPGATNASSGVHVAFQDSTPMILFIGQVGRDMIEREAFQEIDYRRMFGQMAKWVAQIDSAARVPEFVSRAFYTATGGRPGPVVLALPEPSSPPTGRSRPIRGRPTWSACGSSWPRRSGPSRSSAAAAGTPGPAPTSSVSPRPSPCRSAPRSVVRTTSTTTTTATSDTWASGPTRASAGGSRRPTCCC